MMTITKPALIGSGLALMLPATGALAWQEQPPDTDISEVVLYGVDEDTRRLVRYEFGDGSYHDLGPVHLEDNTILDQIESLAYIPGQLQLYGVWNYNGQTQSKLVKINMFTAEATPCESDTGFGNVEGLTVTTNLSRGPGPQQSTSVVLTDSHGVDAYEISFVDVSYNPDGTSSWTYNVRELPTGKDLSHWNLSLSESHVVMPNSTAGYEVGIDPSTGFYGIKWEVTQSFSEGEFTIVLSQHLAGTEGGNGVGVLAKGGNTPDTDEIFGPTENVPKDVAMYALHSDGAGGMALITIDPVTGVGEAQMDLSRAYEDLAVGADGTLFAVYDNQLWQLDPFSDTETLIGESGIHKVQGLDFAFGDHSPTIVIPGVDPALTENGALFGYSDVSNTLVLFDPATGSATPFSSGIVASDLEGMILLTLRRDPQEKLMAASFD